MERGRSVGHRRRATRGSGATAAFAPYATGAYQNYIDPNLPGWQQAYYGANLPGWSVKRAADPDNFFHFAQSIPPA